MFVAQYQAIIKPRKSYYSRIPIIFTHRIGSVFCKGLHYKSVGFRNLGGTSPSIHKPFTPPGVIYRRRWSVVRSRCTIHRLCLVYPSFSLLSSTPVCIIIGRMNTLCIRSSVLVLRLCDLNSLRLQKTVLP